MGAYKFYNPSTEQWEIIKSKSIIKDDGSLEYTPDDIKAIDNKIGNLSTMPTTEKTNLAGAVGEVKNELSSHKADDVLHGKIGTKEVDESEIGDKSTLSYSSELGKWVVRRPTDDLTNSPGSPYLISGTMEEGFFGEVSSSELITGDALASQVGISQGTSQHSTAGWLKFAYKGEIQFIAKKPIRHSISWDAINAAKCVYGDSGDKTVTIDGLTYKVTLMRALEPINDPKTAASANIGEVNHGSEWNRLMCQIHEQAINKSWDFPEAVESDIGILEHSLGSGSQGMYSDADLVVKSGNGRYSWCQEMADSASNRLNRGSNGVSSSRSGTSSSTDSGRGWRPVLRLIG